MKPLPSEPTRRGVYLLPQDSLHRPVVEEVLVSLGGDFPWVSAPEEAEVVLVDLTSGRGRTALEEARARAGGRALRTVALLPEAAAEAHDWAKSVELGDFIRVGALREELPARLFLARREGLKERDLGLLLKLTADYAGSLDVRALLHDVTRMLATEKEIDRVALVALDDAQGKGTIIAASDDAHPTDLKLDLSRYPEIREVVRTGRPVVLEDAPSHPLLEGVRAEVAARGIHALAALPLVDSGRVLGVLLLRASAHRQPFTSREVDFLSTVAHATAVALRNARLVEMVRGQTDQEKAARREAEEKAALLWQTKEFLEKLIDSSVDAIIAADLTGKVILYNRGAEVICGYSREEALGRLNVRGLYPEGVARSVMRRLREGKGKLGATRQDVLNKSGEVVPVTMTASIVYEGNAEVATVGIFADLRDRVRLEQKLSQAEVKLEESEKNAVIVALAGTAAHELNQPLTSVMGYAELLKRRLKEEDFAYRPVDIIHREAERMAEIVRKIGKITRYETKSYVGAAKILDLDKASSHEE